MRTRARGLTLVETLVAAVLAALLLGVLVRVVSMAYRVGNEEISRAALEGEAALAASRLERDLMETSAAGITLSPAKSRVALNPIKTVSISGQRLFQNYLVLWSQGATSYRNESGKWLIRSEITSHQALSDALDSQPIRLTPEQLNALPVGGGQRVTQAFRGVTGFSVEPPAGLEAPAVAATVLFTIELELDLARTRKKVQVKRVVALRSPGL